MRKLYLDNRSEQRVEAILNQNLASNGYRIWAKRRLAEVINTEPRERLSYEEFDYLSRASLDYVIARDNIGVFAVEFDGPAHSTDPRTVQRDVLKNRLCKRAKLPLLRITATEIEEWDQCTILDSMLQRHLAFRSEPREFLLDCDWDVIFDVKHPYPAIMPIADRLWQNHGIAWSQGDHRRVRNARYLCEVEHSNTAYLQSDQFHASAFRVLVWDRAPAPAELLFSEVSSVRIRAWLPLSANVPLPDIWHSAGSSYSGLLWSETMQRRVESMWFPDVPGIYPWDIADSYCKYQALRKAESWAEGKCHSDKA